MIELNMEFIQHVFDNPYLRKEILKHIVYAKYKTELNAQIKELFTHELLKRWYHYCNCELCKSYREYSLATYGELI